MRPVDPGKVVLKLVTFLVRLVGNQRGASEGRSSAQVAGIKVAQTEIHALERVGQIVGHILWHNLDQDRIEKRRRKGVVPGGENAEVSGKEPAGIWIARAAIVVGILQA